MSHQWRESKDIKRHISKTDLHLKKCFNYLGVALSLSTALTPGEKCSPVALRLAGLGCLAAALATPFRDGE